MKIICKTLLLIFLSVMFAGCNESKPIKNNEQLSVELESSIFSESDYEISNTLLSGDYLNKTFEEIDIPDKNLYMEGDGAYGFSDLCFCGIPGNATMLIKGGKTTEITFSTKGIKETVELNNLIKKVNQSVAEGLGVPKNEFELICSDESLEELEAVLSGKGIMKTSYQTNNFTLEITVIGSSGEAVISLVEYKNKGDIR